MVVGPEDHTPWLLRGSTVVPGPFAPSHPPSQGHKPPTPKGLGLRHDGGREASFTAAVAKAATTVAISGLSTLEGWRGRGGLGVPALSALSASFPADLEWC